MINSMTAFHREAQIAECGEFVWEISGVNHRFLELRIRLPDDLRMLEADVRSIISKRIKRGKLDVTLRLNQDQAKNNSIQLDKELVSNLLATAQELIQLGCQQVQPNALELMRWPGVIQGARLDVEEAGELVLALLGKTLDGFISMRQREGARLAELLEQRCQGLEECVARVKARLPEVLQAIHQKMKLRCAELQVNLNAERLEQELAIISMKMDVDEEMDRLIGHVQEVRDLLKKSGHVGRQLDFLMQELNREANTLGSKSADLETTRESVAMKVLIEQMREQVQNIE